MIGTVLKVIRTYYRLTQKRLASDMAISNAYISELEAGDKVPTIAVLRRYSVKFGIPISVILLMAESMDMAKRGANPLDYERHYETSKKIIAWYGDSIDDLKEIGNMTWQEELLQLVDDGVEYPDAEVIITLKYRIDISEIREFYDIQRDVPQ